MCVYTVVAVTFLLKVLWIVSLVNVGGQLTYLQEFVSGILFVFVSPRRPDK